jgi:hypothetical protein
MKILYFGGALTYPWLLEKDRASHRESRKCWGLTCTGPSYVFPIVFLASLTYCILLNLVISSSSSKQVTSLFKLLEEKLNDKKI